MESGRRVPLGLVQVGINPFNEKVRNGVLKDLCFLVHLICSISQGLNEESFDEAMPTHHCDGNGKPFIRQGDSAVGSMGEETLV